MSKEKKKKKEEALTPMLEQYHSIKQKYRDTILLFRLGDFYEMFYDDAQKASKALDLVLTSRYAGKGRRVPMCGFPFHAAQSYIARLLKQGFKVAICEQVEDPKLAKKLVKRDVIQVITPGTVSEPDMLDQKSNNYLMSLNFNENTIGIGVADISTGELLATESTEENLKEFIENEITRFNPSELLLPSHLSEEPIIKEILNIHQEITLTPYHSWVFDTEYGKENILNFFGIKNLSSFNLEDKYYAIGAVSGLIHYLNETQKQIVNHIEKVQFYSKSDFMNLDYPTIKHLELVKNMQDNTRARTLLEVLDSTLTPQGARLLKKWILTPLVDINKINKRLHYVDIFYKHSGERKNIQQLLKKVYDIERVITRVNLGKVTPREIVNLRYSIENALKIKEFIEKNLLWIKEISDKIPDLKDIAELIKNGIYDEPWHQLGEGRVIKEGFNEELDKYRKARKEGKEWILKLQQEEIKRTGIPSLKIGYNKVFGYYIEVTKPNLKYVPSDYIRKQTLANAERFTYPKLQEYEEIILSAEEKIEELEKKVFNEIVEKIKERTSEIKKLSQIISFIDVIVSLAEVAEKNNYVKPEVKEGDQIIIKSGRHPVVEKYIEEEFIPNDTLLDTGENRILIITGPNMAGKSTYLRQVALIVLMAQMGSFVPAEKAEIGIVDRIFTRIGASDDLSRGESTFLVEMNETARILNNATSKSLIIMDEVGRGTSTYDGLSIAWAVLEYIYTNIKAKTLFATHYHELTVLGRKKAIKNYNFLVKEWGDKVIFLRKLAPGAADRSYGIQVAQLAGLPKKIISRAKEILLSLEKDSDKKISLKMDAPQLSLFTIQLQDSNEYKKIIDELKQIDINQITPIEALNILNKLKSML